ncbi:MAG: ATP-binding protein [Candidatus Omnitrophica bacterium]|nr:ATP-binding protein [Candidatus Omnitrophota bacterium]
MTKDRFFGRQYYIETLSKRISGLKDGYRQNIAFLGDEATGKTSVIMHFLSRLDDNRIIPVYLDVRPQIPAQFFRRFLAALLYNFLRNSDTPLKEDLNFLIGKSEKYIPKTCEKVRAILSNLEKNKKDTIFGDLLSLCDSINQETGKFCVLILDEFHNLELMGIKNLYRDWAKVLISQKNVMQIIMSSSKFKAKRILAEDLALLFGNFEVIDVEPFSAKDTENFLYNRLGRDFDRSLANFLVHFTGGYPFYLEIISGALIKSLKGEDALNQVILTDTLEESLFEETGILNQKFSNCLKTLSESSSKVDCASVLYLISGGHNKIKDMAHILHKQRKDIVTRINFLLEASMISRNGDFFQINDRVFGFWLKFVYQLKVDALNLDGTAQKEVFRNAINGMIKEFSVNSQKPLLERTMELLHLFENEAVCVERKRLKLDQFREIKSLTFNCAGLKDGLIGRSADSLWIVAFKQGLVTEDDIAEFSRECKKYKQKVQRKIVITPDCVDANVRLKALDEKILTWDIDNLNQLLDLFSKPRVVI